MRGRNARFGVAAAIVLFAAALAVPAASAGSLTGGLLPSCGAQTYPFAPWLDPDAYCAFPNLGFENGSAGWTLTGDAAVVSGNEPWNVSGPGSHSLQLGPGGAALSSPLPISLIDPWIRFFAQSSGANGNLGVVVIFQGVTGNLTGLLNVGSLSPSGYASWQPTSRISSALALPLLTSTARVLVYSTASHGDWSVDDFYLDPCVSRVG